MIVTLSWEAFREDGDFLREINGPLVHFQLFEQETHSEQVPVFTHASKDNKAIVSWTKCCGPAKFSRRRLSAPIAIPLRRKYPKRDGFALRLRLSDSGGAWVTRKTK